MADIAGERPMTPAPSSNRNSVAKRFTAMAVMLRVSDSRLARDDCTHTVPGLAQASRRAGDGRHIDMPKDNIIAAG